MLFSVPPDAAATNPHFGFSCAIGQKNDPSADFMMIAARQQQRKARGLRIRRSSMYHPKI